MIVLFLIQPRALIHYNKQASAKCPKYKFLFDINSTEWPSPTFFCICKPNTNIPGSERDVAYSLYKLVNRFHVTEKQRHIRSSVSSITPISHYNTLNIPHTKKEMYTACLRLQITAKLTPQISNKCRCTLEAGCDLRCDALASTLPLKWLISHFDGQCKKTDLPW